MWPRYPGAGEIPFGCGINPWGMLALYAPNLQFAWAMEASDGGPSATSIVARSRPEYRISPGSRITWFSGLLISASGAPAHRHHVPAMGRTPATRVDPGPAELRSGAHASDHRGDLHVHLWRRPLGWRLHPIQAGCPGRRRGSMASFATMAVSLALRCCRTDSHRVLDQCPAGASADR